MKKLDEHLKNIQEFDPVTLTAAAVAFSAINVLMMALRTYKEYFTKAARKCKDLTPKEKAMCMVRAKMMAKNIQLMKIKAMVGKCAKAKSPEKCKIKLVNKIQKLSKEIKFYSVRIKQMGTQAYEK